MKEGIQDILKYQRPVERLFHGLSYTAKNVLETSSVISTEQRLK